MEKEKKSEPPLQQKNGTIEASHFVLKSEQAELSHKLSGK